MSSVQDVPLPELCREATPETVMAFVADLYEARGWAVDRREGRRLVASADGYERRIGVGQPDAPTPDPDLVAWADAVVVPDSAAGSVYVNVDVEVVGPAALRRRLAYAVDRPVARRLLQTHFGWEPESDDPADESGGADAGADGDETKRSAGSGVLGPAVGRSQVFLVAVLAVAAAGGVAVMFADELGGPDRAGGSNDGTPATASIEDQTPVVGGTPAPETATRTPVIEGQVETSRLSSLPPGVNESGEIDRERISDAHQSVLANESYRLTLTYEESVDGQPSGIHTETIRVANNTRYSTSVTSHGTFRAPVPTISEMDVYANGSTRFERGDNSTVQRSPLLSYDRFLAGQGRFLTVFLNARESAIVDIRTDDPRTVYVVTDGNPATLIRNMSGSVDIREDGLVTRARWSYEFSGQLTAYDNVTASFGLQVTDVGTTVVQEPGWVPENVTNETTATATNETTATATDETTDTATDETTATATGGAD